MQTHVKNIKYQFKHCLPIKENSPHKNKTTAIAYVTIQLYY